MGGCFSKQNAGTLTLSGTNSYSGTTTVSGGLLLATKPAALPGYNTPGDISVTGGTLGVRFSGGSTVAFATTDVNALFSANGVNFATGSTLALDTTNGSVSYNTVMSGNYGLTKLGSNALVLPVGENYAGVTTVTSGSLSIGVNGALPSTASVVTAGGVLWLNTYSQTIGLLTSSVTASGGVVLGSGTLTVANTASDTFGARISGGASGQFRQAKHRLAHAHRRQHLHLPDHRPRRDVGAWHERQTPVLGSGAAGADIQGGKLVFDYTTSDPATTIANMLKTSYGSNFLSGQLKDSTAGTTHLALGWKDDAVADQVIVMATVPGDASLDGTTNGADLTTVLSNYDKTGMTWSQGDFNYDGTVNGADLTIVLSNYDQHVNIGAAVPEPGTLLLAAAGLVGLLAYAWRRRK